MATLAPAAPLLAGGPVGWVAFGAIAVGTVGVAGYYYFTRPNHASMSADQTQARTNTATKQECKDCIHRGRVQAQGGGLEKSRKWEQPRPATVGQGLGLLTELYSILSRSQQRERETGYEQARKWISTRPPVGVYAVVKKSFPQPALRGGIRMDVEVLAGEAFKA